MFDAVLRCGADRGIVDFGLDATDMGRPVYVKRGFVDRFAMNRWSCASPKAVAMPGKSVRPLAAADWDQIIAMDRRATQVNRTALLKRLAEEPSAGSLVVEDGGKLRGSGCCVPVARRRILGDCGG